MTADDAILDFVEPILGQGWRCQFGRWEEDAVNGRTRYAVLQPAGGGRAEVIRTPQFTLKLIGLDGGDLDATKAAAHALIEAMRASSGRLVFMQPGEPAYLPTSDGRPVFEFAIAAITT